MKRIVILISGRGSNMEAMLRAATLHRLHPVIDRVFPFADARDAYRHLERRAHFGKVVIRHD